jgi:hypothetical protein
MMKDPDDALVVLFKHNDYKNETKSLAEGRPVHDDLEVCEIRMPGAKDVKVFPATEISFWRNNPYTGEQTPVTYAERFAPQYRQFKMQIAQTKSGTPLDLVPFLTAARRAELRAQNLYTVEQLAVIDGQELKNLGPDGRAFKNNAIAYLEESKSSAPNMQLMAELEAMRARNAVLEEDAKLLKARIPQTAERDFDEMDVEQLRAYIISHTGQPPVGTALNHKALKRLALEVKPSKAA